MAAAMPSKNLARPAAKRQVNREHLANAVLSSITGEFTDFACVKQLTKEAFGFDAFRIVDGLDVNIQLPASLQDIECLKQHAVKNVLNPTGMNICTTPQDLDLSGLVIQHLGLPSGLMNVQASPIQLILYDRQTGQKYCWPTVPSISDSKLVTGKVILQLPVEGGHDGGALKVSYNGTSKMLENAQSSDQCFYMSAFYNFCSDVMEPLKRGYKLTFVYNLVWANDVAMNIKEIPCFLTTLKKTKTALAAWLNPNSLEDQGDLQLGLPEEDDSDENDSTTSSTEDVFENFRLSTETLSDDVLFFVLQENYGENDLKFSRLRGRDGNLARILPSCDFLDVHLACVTLKSFNMEYGGMSRCATEDLSVKITRWIDSNDVIQNLNMELNWDQQRVGPLRKLLKTGDETPHKEKRTPITKEEEEDLEDTNYMPLLLGCMPESRRPRPVKRTQYYFRGVLVIWPKNQSPLMYCRYGMSSLLEEMENSLNSATPGQEEETRKQVLPKLQKIIGFCCTEPNKAWNYVETYQIFKKKKNTMEKGELTQKLLRICITLKAREEGLQLLKSLGSSYLSGSYYDKEKKFEGIQTKEVANVIADFVQQVAGWNDCSELIKLIISPDRINKQLSPIIELAQRLLEFGCVEGAKMIGEGLVSSVVSCLNSENLQYDLLKEVSSSFVWATLDSALKINIVSACTNQVEKKFADVRTLLESVPDSKEERFHIIRLLDAMSYCSKFFILSEKNRCDLQQKNVVQDFNPLLAKLPTLVVMHLILGIYKEESETSLSIKDFPTLLDWYRTVCKIFFSQDIIAAINDVKNNTNCEEITSKIVKCLLWLNDQQTWQLFSQEMCRFTYENNPIVRFLSSKNVEILNAIVDSTLAFDTFVIIMDHWTKQLTSIKEPSFNWKQPSAILPVYPELEDFLRSDKESMVYSDLSCIDEARFFAAQLEMVGKSNGFSVKATPRGNRNSGCCTISKNRSFFNKQLESFRARRLEMQELSKQFKTFHQKRHASK